MTSVRRLQWRGQVERRAEAVGLVKAAYDAVLVHRGRPRLVLIGCPCGCGDEVVVTVDIELNGAWRFYRDRRGTSLYPSVWRDDGCQSHFIVWNDRVFLFGGRRMASLEETAEPQLESRVQSLLRGCGASHYFQIAEALNEIPWSIWTALRALERRGIVLRTAEDDDVFQLTEVGMQRD